jgi:hypothetical protein
MSPFLFFGVTPVGTLLYVISITRSALGIVTGTPCVFRLDYASGSAACMAEFDFTA